MGEGLVELNEDQLRRLSKIVHEQELDRIRTIPFGSEYERVQHLQICNSNHNTIQSLLDKVQGLIKDLQREETKREIAHLIWELEKSLVNFGIQAIRNYSVRKEFLEKVVAHAEETMAQARMLSPTDEAALRRLAKDAEQFKQGISKFMATHRSTLSKVFSEQINQEGISFEQLVTRYKLRRGLTGPFKDLSPEERFEVYHDIIKDSGRGPIVDEAFAASRKDLVGGFALFAFVAAVTVWDIYTAPKAKVIEQATKDMKDIAASITGSTLGHFVESALLDTDFALMAGAETLITVVGFVSGVVIGMVLSILGGAVIDAIFNSGGERVSNAQEVRIYVAPMPDGEALAREISRS